jgi:hypothetical protein
LSGERHFLAFTLCLDQHCLAILALAQAGVDLLYFLGERLRTEGVRWQDLLTHDGLEGIGREGLPAQGTGRRDLLGSSILVGGRQQRLTSAIEALQGMVILLVDRVALAVLILVRWWLPLGVLSRARKLVRLASEDSPPVTVALEGPRELCLEWNSPLSTLTVHLLVDHRPWSASSC